MRVYALPRPTLARAAHRCDSQHMAVTLRSWQRRQSLLQLPLLDVGQTQQFSRNGTDRYQTSNEEFCRLFSKREREQTVFSFLFV